MNGSPQYEACLAGEIVLPVAAELLCRLWSDKSLGRVDRVTLTVSVTGDKEVASRSVDVVMPRTESDARLRMHPVCAACGVTCPLYNEGIVHAMAVENGLRKR